MSQQTFSPEQPFIDLSDEAGKRRTFRRLLLALVATFGGCIAASAFGELPESIAVALALEEEMVAAWKNTLASIVVLALLAGFVWAIYELWAFRASGLPKLLLLVLAPLFLVATTPAVMTPFAEYLRELSCVLMGMVLFMGWATPEIFQSQSQTQGTSVK